MTFAELVTDILNGKHPERAKEGRIVTVDSLNEQIQAVCEALDKYRVYPPGVSGIATQPGKVSHVEPLKLTSVDELGLDL